jgi:hypothetical protein
MSSRYQDDALLVVKPNALAFPFKRTEHNGRNRLWLEVVNYVAVHRAGMPVSAFRRAARAYPYLERDGDTDITMYVDKGLIEDPGSV